MDKTKALKEKEQKKEDRIRQAKEKWQRPTLEDVSGKIMAQPYIRFT